MTETNQQTEDVTESKSKTTGFSISRVFRRGAIRLENSALFMYLRAFSRAGIILIALGFFLDMDQRQAATMFRAWQTLTTDAPGNVGKADAMAYLVSMGEPLNRISTRGAYLAGAQLSGASLDEADLSDTDLTNAALNGATLIETKLNNAVLVAVNFRGAFLDNADLQNARLIRADFTKASLVGADLRNGALDAATLSNADLSQANLENVSFGGATLTGTTFAGANVSGAKFDRASGLIAAQLEQACVRDGRRPVELPDGSEFAALEFDSCPIP